ncbi:calpain-C isoform X4 [Drosophila ananassae]|uniref:calpain-C isoform X4 n=1 Tax=Drosophila ananassae TaxID=7217 RepID=UPI001CFF7032|nr:calpain-C isoform X4 [Drosophila ananassae]
MATMASKYECILSDCQTKSILWEDPDFPAVQSSVFYYQTPPFTFQWKRIAELNHAQAIFLSEGAEFDVVPGKMGDRWLVSCLGVLCSLRNLFYRVVPADQTLVKAHGVFRFRLWWCGEWVEVLVDDRLPTINGRLAFMQPQTSQCFWAALLEKAIAKLHGSYEALKYGTRSDGLTDLLGGVVRCMPIVKDTIRPQTLKDQLATTCIVTCLASKNVSVQKKNVAERLPNGILLNVNYSFFTISTIVKGNRTTDCSQSYKYKLIFKCFKLKKPLWNKDFGDCGKLLLILERNMFQTLFRMCLSIQMFLRAFQFRQSGDPHGGFRAVNQHKRYIFHQTLWRKNALPWRLVATLKDVGTCIVSRTTAFGQSPGPRRILDVILRLCTDLQQLGSSLPRFGHGKRRGNA